VRAVLVVARVRPSSCCMMRVRRHVCIRYRLHNDWFNPSEPGYSDKMIAGGQRLVSIFIYLQQPAAGGCTWFPHLGRSGVAFAPVIGNGIMWCARCVPRIPPPLPRMTGVRYNMTKDNAVDARVLHAGMPVVEGEKWGMNIWIREFAVPLPSPPPPPPPHPPSQASDGAVDGENSSR
jgi:prolyl 4-hydroxylase